MKLFSDKFIERAKELGILPQMMGFYKSTIRMYPFITSKGWMDIRKVFKQSKSDDEFLKRYYKEYFVEGAPLIENAKSIAIAVEDRLTYRFDSDNWGQLEYWANPITVHQRRYDDCDGYSVLITYLLRLFGAQEFEVFTSAGWVNYLDKYSSTYKIDPNNSTYHAYTVVTDIYQAASWAVEGSFYHKLSMNELGDPNYQIQRNARYKKPDWITNDKVSYNSWPFMRFVK